MGFSSVVQNSPIGQVGPLSRPSGKNGFADSQPPQQPTYSAMPQQSSGKGGQQGQVTYPVTSGQQQMGMPNQYSNTVGQWDNAQIQPMRQSGGKGKGA